MSLKKTLGFLGLKLACVKSSHALWNRMVGIGGPMHETVLSAMQQSGVSLICHCTTRQPAVHTGLYIMCMGDITTEPMMNTSQLLWW